MLSDERDKIFMSNQFTIFKQIQHCPGSLRYEAKGNIDSMFFEYPAFETDAGKLAYR